MRVLLHIGQSKTGSSAIQAFLMLNRQKLREMGVLYPAAKIKGMPVNMGDHNAVADALAGKSSFPYLTADEYFQQFFEEAKSINANLLILSAEHFFAGEPRTWDVLDEEEYFKRYEQKVQNLAAYLSGHEVSILVYLRPQVDWLSSAVSQNVRIDRLISDRQLYHNDRQFFEVVKPLLRYSILLDVWARILKPSSFMAIPYDRKTLVKNSSIADFLHHAGLENTVFPYASTDIQVNESLTREYIEVKKILNGFRRTKNEERVIICCLTRLSMSSNAGTRYALDAGVQQDVESFVSHDNEKLNKQYQTDGLIFMSRNEGQSREQKPLNDEDVARAMDAFEREYRRPRYRLLWLNFATRAFLRTYAKPVQAALHQLKMTYLNMKYRN